MQRKLADDESLHLFGSRPYAIRPSDDWRKSGDNEIIYPDLLRTIIEKN